ncbi:MAG: hypothetical protein CSA70_03170 [Rhodobacterales bacterium]|nr:MAG: hypothetical protein CSA70_03170 [Rhodobacterales bacterium]
MSALSVFAFTATMASAGSLVDPVVESEPQGDPFAAAPSSGSLGGNAGAIAAGVVLVGLLIVASDGS